MISAPYSYYLSHNFSVPDPDLCHIFKQTRWASICDSHRNLAVTSCSDVINSLQQICTWTLGCIHLLTDIPPFLDLTHMATIDSAEPQIAYQLDRMGCPVKETSIVHTAPAVH